MRKVLISLIFSILLTIVIGSEEEENFSNDQTPQLQEEPNEFNNVKSIVKRQASRRPSGLFGLLASFLRQPSYNNQQNQNYNRQGQYYRPQQTFTQRPQFGGYQPNYYNQQRPQYYNQYQPFNFIEHLNKLPRNSETFGYYLDPYHGRRLPENERHLWGPSEAYRESLRGRTAIFYYRGYQNFVSKIAFNPHRGVKMYVENVGNISGF